MTTISDDILEAVIAYRRRGWHVIPLHTPIFDADPATGVVVQIRCSCRAREECAAIGKHPIYKDWMSGNFPPQPDQWITHGWRGNIGILVQQSKLLVIDIDPRNGGDDGWERYCADYGAPPPTLIASTGGGGKHYYFITPDEWRPNLPALNKNLAPGVDFKWNGFVVAPPSLHRSGQKYQWINDNEITVFPSSYFRPATDPELGHRQPAGRNDALTSYAGRCINEGINTFDALFSALQLENFTRFPENPLPEREVRSIAKSAIKNFKPRMSATEKRRQQRQSIIDVLKSRWYVMQSSTFQIVYRRADHGKYLITLSYEDQIREVVRELVKTGTQETARYIKELRETAIFEAPALDRSVYEQKNYIGFKNYIYDPAAGRVRVPEDIVEYPVDPLWEYNEDYVNSRSDSLFEQALRRWLPISDEAHFDWCMQLVAYFSLWPSNGLQIWLNPSGVGGTGKSRFVDAITALVGRSRVADVQFNNLHQFVLGAYIDTPLLISRDAPPYVSNPELIRMITGDEIIPVEKKYLDPFSVKNRWKIIITTNEPIRSKDDTYAWMRRLIILPFRTQFPPNPEFARALIADDQICRLAHNLLPYTEALCSRSDFHSDAPPWISEALNEYKTNVSYIYAWWEETYTDDTSHWPNEVSVFEAWADFQAWMMQKNIKNKLTIQSFGGRAGKLASILAPRGYIYIKTSNVRKFRRVASSGLADSGNQPSILVS